MRWVKEPPDHLISLFAVLAEEIAPKIDGINIKLLAGGRLVRRRRPVERVAAFAAVKLGMPAEFLDGGFLFIA